MAHATSTLELTLGEVLKVVRERGHLTQKDMADRLELGRNTVVRYESDLTVPRWRDVVAWAAEAGQPADALRHYWEVAHDRVAEEHLKSSVTTRYAFLRKQVA